MAEQQRVRGMLAAQVVRLTLIIGALVVIAALVVAIISVSRLSADAARNRDLRALQSIEDAAESRLRSTAAVIDQATSRTQTVGVLKERLSVAYEDHQDTLSQVIIADRTGHAISNIPANASVGRLRTEPAFLNALAGRSGFLSKPAADGEPMELWLTRTVFDKSGEPILVLVQLNTGFLNGLASATAADLPRRTLLLMQQGAVISRFDSGARPDIGRAQWTQLGPQWGSVRVMTRDGALLEGHYNDIGGIEGIGWRAVIMSPASAQLTDTVKAVTPPILVLLVGGMVALAAAWIVAQQMSRPLRDLERAALNAASGSYVRSLSTERDDEIGRVSEAFNAVAVRLNALQDLSQLLASTSSLDQVLDGTLVAVGHMIAPRASAILLVEQDADVLVPARTKGFEFSELCPIDLAEGTWMMSVLQAEGPTTFGGPIEDLADELPGVKFEEMGVIGTALVSGQELLGAIVVARDPERRLTDAELEMLKTFSAQAAVAIQTSRLFEIESQSRRTAETLRLVAEQLVRPKSLLLALDTVEAIIAELFSAPSAMIAVADREVLGLSAEGANESEAHLLEAAYHVLGQGSSKGPIVLEAGVSAAHDRVLERLGAEWALLVPVALDTDHGAVLAVPLPGPLSEESVEFGRAIGDEIALALDNAYFYQRAVTRAANLETIFRISQAVGSSLQVNVVLNRVLDVVQKILSADAVALMSYDPGRRVLTTTMGRGNLPRPLLHLEVERGEDIPGQVYVRGKPVAIRDMNPGSDGVARLSAEHDLRSLLAVPLLARGRSIGVLMVFAHEAGAFSDEDLSTLQTFASQAALAIDTARLYSREHEVASILQASIVPEDLPDYPGLDAGSVYAPAGGDAEIGGDYYDLFRVSDGAVWIAIADVCGKGVHAATKTSMIKYVIRALTNAGLRPAAIVSRVNDMIAEADDPSDIVTLWLGRYEPDSRVLSWADGGHPAGLVRRNDGSIEPLGVTGALLGAMLGAPYDENETKIEAGERLLLYTDGVSEARRGNIFFGEDRIRAVLSQNLDSATTATNLLKAVRDYVQGDLRDDVAVLVVAPRSEREDDKTGNA